MSFYRMLRVEDLRLAGHFDRFFISTGLVISSFSLHGEVNGAIEVK